MSARSAASSATHARRSPSTSTPTCSNGRATPPTSAPPWPPAASPTSSRKPPRQNPTPRPARGQGGLRDRNARSSAAASVAKRANAELLDRGLTNALCPRRKDHLLRNPADFQGFRWSQPNISRTTPRGFQTVRSPCRPDHRRSPGSRRRTIWTQQRPLHFAHPSAGIFWPCLAVFARMTLEMDKRTRLGKIVGSYRQPLGRVDLLGREKLGHEGRWLRGRSSFRRTL